MKLIVDSLRKDGKYKTRIIFDAGVDGFGNSTSKTFNKLFTAKQIREYIKENKDCIFKVPANVLNYY